MGFSFSIDYRAIIIATLGKILTDLGVIASEELPAALHEFIVQEQTPDGWTADERAHYLIGRLTVIKARTVGNVIVDRAVDMGIQILIDYLVKKEAQPAPLPPGPVPVPVPEPTPAPQPAPAPVPAPQPTPAPVPPPVSQPYPFGAVLDAPPDKTKLSNGNAIYITNKDPRHWMVTETKLVVGMAGWVLTDVIGE